MPRKRLVIKTDKGVVPLFRLAFFLLTGGFVALATVEGKAFVTEPSQQEKADVPLGRDADGNGVWDDVYEYLVKYPAEPYLRSLIDALTVAYQNTLLVKTRGEALRRWQEMEQIRACMQQYFIDLDPRAASFRNQAEHISTLIESQVYAKNDRRAGAFLNFSGLLPYDRLEQQECLQ